MAKFIYETVKEYLMELINLNKNNPNYKLPSENQLAVKFKTTRVTAKRALTALTEEGYIYRMHGKGSFIQKNFSSPLPPTDKDFVCMFLPNLKSDFITTIIDGAANYLESTGIELIVCSNNENYSISSSFFKKIVDFGAKGIIFFPFENGSYNKDLMLLAINNFPVVFIDRTLASFEISTVMSNHFESAKNATKFLMEKGANEIALLTTSPTGSSSVYDRERGYTAAHIDAERAMKSSNILTINESDPNLCETITEFLKRSRSINGILSIGGATGIALMRAIKNLGIKIPEELQVIFYDDEYAPYADLLPFAPTCIKQNGFRIGSEAARVVTNLIRTNNSVNENLKIDCMLIERESTKQ